MGIIITYDLITGERTEREETAEERAITHPAEPLYVPSTITRKQCAKMLFNKNFITSAEAVAMAAWAEPPADIETLLASLPEPDQTNARIDFASELYERTNPLLNGIMTGSTSEEIDQFFIEASKL